MKHRATSQFWAAYRQLPEEVQELAEQCFQLLKADSRHPSIHFKRIGELWSARIGLHYRALALDEQGEAVWFWIGTHAEYSKRLRKT